MLRALTKCPPLICHSLCPSQLSAGRVKVRVLKDDPGESSRLENSGHVLKMARPTSWRLACRSDNSTEQHPGNC